MTVKIVSHVEDHGYFPIVKGKQLFVGLTHDGMTKSFLVDHDRYPSASGPFSSRQSALDFVGDMLRGVGVFGVEFHVVPLVRGEESNDD